MISLPPGGRQRHVVTTEPFAASFVGTVQEFLAAHAAQGGYERHWRYGVLLYAEKSLVPSVDPIRAAPFMLAAVDEITFLIVSGLPASGKSTLARSLAEHLRLPLIDKDRILESLFDSLGVGDHAWRSRLSRASDEVLLALAEESRGAVLDNWWHHDWARKHLSQLGGHLIEVFCDCPVELASARFRSRRRHRGHLDPDLTDEQAAERIEAVRASFRGRLGLGSLVTVDTSIPVDVAAVVRAVQRLMPTRPAPLFP